MSIGLTRLSIYERLKIIAQTHKGAKQENEARCFMVGHDYELNTNNLMKGDSQMGNIQLPEFFYSEKWREAGLNPEGICKDFPLIFLTPGTRNVTRSDFGNGYSLATFVFQMVVFDLMSYDRNNMAGNETALRERERIWFDTENILLEIMTAFQDREITSIYNRMLAGIALGLPEDVSSWNPAQDAQADAYLKDYLQRANFEITVNREITPFDYQHNDRLAGVDIVFSTNIIMDCPAGTFVQTLC
jgi:hypothetical protein